MIGRKGNPTVMIGRKGVSPFGLIGGLHKGQGVHQSTRKTTEMVAQAPKYGSLEKK